MLVNWTEIPGRKGYAFAYPMLDLLPLLKTVQYSNSVVWRREKLAVRPPRERYNMYMVGLIWCYAFTAIEATASVQDASVGVCALRLNRFIVRMGLRSIAQKASFEVDCIFFPEDSLSPTMTPVRPDNCMSLLRLDDICLHLFLLNYLVIDYVSDFTDRVCWLI